MRIIVFVACLSVITPSSAAQAEEQESSKVVPMGEDTAEYLQGGLVELAPSINFARTQLERSDINSYYLNGSVLAAYLFNPNIEIGLELGFSSNFEEDTSTDDVSSLTTAYVGPVWIINIPTRSPVTPYFSAMIGVAHTRYKLNTSGSDIKDDTTSFMFSVAGGLRFFVSQTVALNVGAGFSRTHREEDWGGDLDQIFAALGLSVFL